MPTRRDIAGLLSRINIVDVVGEHVELKRDGAEYSACCPFHTEKSPSFKVSEQKQIYHCFGCGENGDAIAFLQRHLGVTFKAAVAQLNAKLGLASSPSGDRAPTAPRKSTWSPLPVASPRAPPPPKAHVSRGKPEAVWTYRRSTGAVIGYVYRFRTSDGGKEVLPLTWCRNAEDGKEDWRWMQFQPPRPLYGLDRLAAKPDATVLVVEGEKCADAAHDALLELACVSWPGGGKAVAKVDWSPLAGCKVILWPDCDSKREKLSKAEQEAGVEQLNKPYLPVEQQPGVAAMRQLAEILLKQGCKVGMLAIPEPGQVPDGWDVADAVADADFMSACGDAGLSGYVRSRVKTYGNAPVSAASASGGRTVPPNSGRSALAELPDDVPWQSKLMRDAKGRFRDCRENVFLMLLHHPLLKGCCCANIFTRKMVVRRPLPWQHEAKFVDGMEWTSFDSLELGMWIAAQYGTVIRNAEILHIAAGWAASYRPWHPLREHLDALSWDGVHRDEMWMSDFLGARDDAYTRLCSQLSLRAMAARAYEPGCVMRTMPILEGSQYRGKSTALRILGGPWYSDTLLDLNNKDTYQIIQGVWVYEIGELDAFNKAETTRIKGFISSASDTYRAPYEREPKQQLRETCFFGTTNQDEYFKDLTGNTRFWPVRVEVDGPIKLDKLAAMRDQLLAEAVAKYKQGERWHLTREEQETLFAPVQQEREIPDLWESKIHSFLRTTAKDRLSALEIATQALTIEVAKIDGTRTTSTRIGLIMKRLGWLKGRDPSGDREYFYFRPEGWELEPPQ